ncbi:MAG: hypothetical protein AAF517_17910 [Planctomycetota bacterium]
MALYRLGLFERAASRLRGARKAYRILPPFRMSARVPAFLALTLERQGRTKEAREALSELFDLEKTRAWGASPYVLETLRTLGPPPAPR